MEARAKFRVKYVEHSESTEKKVTLVPVTVDEVVDDFEALTDEEFDRITDELEGFRFAKESAVATDLVGGYRERAVVIHTTEEIGPGEVVEFALSTSVRKTTSAPR